MKIGIVTFYAANNCGAMLQCYASYAAIRKLFPDAEVRVVDFLHDTRRKAPSALNILRQSYRKNHSVPKSVFHALDSARERLHSHGASLFQDFIEQYADLDANAGLDAERRLVCSGYDALITGSDQVFAGCQPYFFLDATQERQPVKVAYAPSFGNLENLPDSQYQWVADKLSSFRTLSCRETDGCAFVEKLTGRACPLVLDPTMLLSAEDWLSIARRPEGVPDGGYVFSYELWRCSNTMATAERAARELGVPMVRAKYFNEGTKFYNRIGPREFIWLIAHAKHVITHSFHGSVFSALLGTPFHVLATTAPQARITTLLPILGLEDRRIRNCSEWDAARPQPTPEAIQERLSQYKQGSLEYLRSALSGILL